jgi:hypothetical protein
MDRMTVSSSKLACCGPNPAYRNGIIQQSVLANAATPSSGFDPTEGR